MTTRLGLGIGTDEVRAVLARRGRVAWTGSRAVNRADSLSDVITEVIRSAPLRRFPRTPVIAALGPAFAQVKRLVGVSPEARGPVVNQLVRSNATRFFLRNGIPLAVASAHRDADRWWGAAMEATAVDSVRSACSEGSVYLEGCVPSLIAIAFLTPTGDGEIELADGPVRTRLHVAKGHWTESRREHHDSDDVASVSTAIAARHGLDPRFADALGAALGSPRSALFLRAPRSRLTSRRLRAVRLALAVLALSSVATATGAPGLAARREKMRDEAVLRGMRETLARWSPALAALAQTTAALNEVGTFSARRQSVALLLGAISRALPDSTAIVNLRVDSVGGSMTVLSLAAASIVPRLAEAHGIVDPKIMGAVTRETVSGRQLQRITVRFGLSSAAGGAR